MRIRVACDLRVRQHGFKTTGYTQWVAGDLLAFYLSGKSFRRGPAEIKMKLHGTRYGIAAKVRILTVDRPRGTGDYLYTARITEIADRHREQLDLWLEELSRPSSARHAPVTSRSTESGTGRRKSLGGALKHGLDKGRSGGKKETHKAARRGPVFPPIFDVSPDAQTITVTWQDWASVGGSLDKGLADDKLEVPYRARHPPVGWDLTVRLRLPDRSTHAAMGRVVRSEGAFLYLALSLKDSTKAALRSGG